MTDAVLVRQGRIPDDRVEVPGVMGYLEDLRRRMQGGLPVTEANLVELVRRAYACGTRDGAAAAEGRGP